MFLNNSAQAICRSATQRETGSRCPCCSAVIIADEPIAICRACAGVHHESCWNRVEGCGSYSCAPSRRDPAQQMETPLRISAADLDRAVPLPQPLGYARAVALPPPAKPVRSRLAIAAFVCAVVGI